jgi:ferric-dicitrate binding protein FerR (iron transport regulator)
MSNDRNSPDSFDAADEQVSAIYSELADERAPEHLNRRILQRAEKTGRRRYLPAAPWMRPVAWAVVVGLSLAIVLEVSRMPTPGIDGADVAAPDNRPANRQACRRNEARQ